MTGAGASGAPAPGGGLPVTRAVRRHNLRTQLPLLVALVLLWLVLWGHVDLISVLTGVAFSLLVVRVFYLPAVALSGRFNLLRALQFFGWFLRRLTVASFQVAWLAVRPGPLPRNSIVAVPLRTRSDFILTLTAEVNILVPGSIVVEADRRGSVLYLHVIDCDTPQKVEAAVRDALESEQGITLALGSRDDIWRINRDRASHGLPRVGQSRGQRAHEATRDRQLDERRRELEATGSFPTDAQLEDQMIAEAEATRLGSSAADGASAEAPASDRERAS